MVRYGFMDEARFGRISDTRACWCPKPFRPVCQAMVTHQYTYAYGAVSVHSGGFDSLILPYVNGKCTQTFLQEVSRRYPRDRIVMVMDGAGWHKNQTIDLPDNMRVLFLPPYAPELRPVEHVWDELREKWFHNRVFVSLEALEQHLESALLILENDPSRMRSITAWPWIINAHMI
ncbi:MAG: transposase [Magnetococcales bacterium]|nr:transposase [Magnetococcales bacterium]